VLSIGWNPFYGNKEKTVEPHLVHKFDADFYGATMRLCICGWIRPEKNFSSLGAPATLVLVTPSLLHYSLALEFFILRLISSMTLLDSHVERCHQKH
jgi:hypothetical protein